MNDFKISPHFTFFEMTRTDVRPLQDQNRAEANTSKLIYAGETLCKSLLEPIREHFNAPLIIHSGFRGPKLNKAIGGSTTSQHMKFEAADFHINGHTLTEVFNWIWKESGLHWGQLILEGGSKTTPPTWIHISLGKPFFAKAGQVMTWQQGVGYRRLQ